MHPNERVTYRRLVIGNKRMPDIVSHERFWAYVDRVAATPEPIVQDLRAQRDATKLHGWRLVEPPRPVGRGVYAVADHDEHAHLAYRLEPPRVPGVVQRDLRIASEASYVVAVAHPGPDERARRFEPLTVADLETIGTEVELIAASAEVYAKLSIELDIARETERTAEMFTELALDRRAHALEPLLERLSA
jgi:hypothetical protein